jgi:hypothetical protein
MNVRNHRLILLALDRVIQKHESELAALRLLSDIESRCPTLLREFCHMYVECENRNENRPAVGQLAFDFNRRIKNDKSTIG